MVTDDYRPQRHVIGPRRAACYRSSEGGQLVSVETGGQRPAPRPSVSANQPSPRSRRACSCCARYEPTMPARAETSRRSCSSLIGATCAGPKVNSRSSGRPRPRPAFAFTGRARQRPPWFINDRLTGWSRTDRRLRANSRILHNEPHYRWSERSKYRLARTWSGDYSRMSNCGPPGTRTPNLLIKSQQLCH